MATAAYSSALSNWLASQQESRQKYAEAESPLIQLQSEFAPGGSYEKGQFDIINQEGLKAGAEGMQNLTATGMSSGSLAVGLGARIRQGVAAGKTGIEATRVSNLTDVLKSLSGLRGAAAGQIGSAYNPFANAEINSETSIKNTTADLSQSNTNSLRSYLLQKQQLDAQNKPKSFFDETPITAPGSSNSNNSFELPQFQW